MEARYSGSDQSKAADLDEDPRALEARLEGTNRMFLAMMAKGITPEQLCHQLNAAKGEELRS